tara:strand:- start:33 stop:419 length:387 start_codon:yes stop_codon:yes gene_type:complete
MVAKLARCTSNTFAHKEAEEDNAQRAFALTRVMRRLGRVPVTIDTAKDLAKAMRDIAKRDNVSEDEQKRRLRICSECPHYTGSRCELCGCFMGFKARLRSSTCPIDRWSSTFGEATIDNTNQREGDEQ